MSAWLPLLLLALQDPAPVDPVVPEPAAAQEDEAVPDTAATEAREPAAPADPRTFAELEAALQALAKEHPERARLESIGRSASGRPIWVLTIAAERGDEGSEDASAQDPDPKPALFVYEGGDRLAAGGSLALSLARRLCGAADARPGALLERTTFYLAPAVDPDSCAPVPETSGRSEGRPTRHATARVAYERNFPLGWQPDAMCHGSGDYPLSKPAALALARFLATRPNLVVAWGGCSPGGGGALPRWFELPEGDEAVLAGLSAESRAAGELVGWNPITPTGGGSLDYAYQAHGIFTLGSCVPAESDGAPSTEQRVDRALLLATRLPRLVLEPTGIVRVGVNLWQLDLNLANVGALPTMSALGLARRGDGALALGLSGARLVASAARRMDAEGFELGDHGEGATGIAIERLEGGERRGLRVVVEAEPGKEVRVVVRGPWVADVAQTITIP